MRGGIFICYRREDSAGFAGRIYDRLKASLGRESVFIDVDNIPAGRDFVEVLSERVGGCDALIAVIGRKWLASADNDNRRRLDDPTDFVRIEIGAALERDVPVIPVLVDGAAMPRADDLPDALKKLARRQGIEISHNRFDSDAERLTDALAQIDPDAPMRPSMSRTAIAALPMPTKRSASARWVIPLIGLVIIAGGAVFLYEQRGPRDDAARQEQTAPRAEVKPTSDLPKPPPPVETSSAPNTAASAPPVVIAASPPPDNPANAAAPTVAPSQSPAANADDSAPTKIGKSDAPDAPPVSASNAAAPTPSAASDDAQAGKIADAAPAKIGKPDTSDAPPASLQWMNIQDFISVYNQKAARNLYPDKVWGRCWKEVLQRGVDHWSPRHMGQTIVINHTVDDASAEHRGDDADFKADAAERTANGFKIRFDHAYEGCDGAKRHVTLWVRQD